MGGIRQTLCSGCVSLVHFRCKLGRLHVNRYKILAPVRYYFNAWTHCMPQLTSTDIRFIKLRKDLKKCQRYLQKIFVCHWLQITWRTMYSIHMTCAPCCCAYFFRCDYKSLFTNAMYWLIFLRLLHWYGDFDASMPLPGGSEENMENMDSHLMFSYKNTTKRKLCLWFVECTIRNNMKVWFENTSLAPAMPRSISGHNVIRVIFKYMTRSNVRDSFSEYVLPISPP